MKQMEAQKWKDVCSQLEKQLKELQAALSPSPSRVRISFLLNHKCTSYVVMYVQHDAKLILHTI